MTGSRAGAGLLVGFVTVVALLLPVIGAVVGSGESSPQALPVTLREGVVPAAYQQALATAGRLCPQAPAPVLAAQLEAESAWNPQATSPAGAQGMAQFMPGTWALYGRDGDGDGRADPYNPYDAIASQAAYDCALARQLAPAITAGQLHGDATQLMLAAYNAGPDAVLRHGGIPPFDETTTYVQRIMTRATYYATPPVLADPGQPAAGSLGPRIVAAASTQLGVPYAWGGGSATGPTRGFAQGAGTIGFDCSGLVLYAVAQASGGQITMPRLADDQTRVGTPVTDLTQLQPGDLISFTRRGETAAHHIGIYAGGNRMIHAPETGSVVETTSLTTSYWKGQQWRAVRLG